MYFIQNQVCNDEWEQVELQINKLLNGKLCII